MWGVIIRYQKDSILVASTPFPCDGHAFTYAHDATMIINSILGPDVALIISKPLSRGMGFHGIILIY